jgi:sec-independent protein translocase protein TatA
MPNIGPLELIVILAVALIVLGPKRLPVAGRSLGQGLREFRDGLTLHEGDDPPARAAVAAGAERRPGAR